MCSKNRDTIGNVAESEGLEQRDQFFVLVGEVHVEEASVGAEVVGGPGGPKVEEGEREGEGTGESGESSSEGGGEGGEDQAEGGEEIGQRGEKTSEERSESEAKGGRGSPPQRGKVVFELVEQERWVEVQCDQ